MKPPSLVQHPFISSSVVPTCFGEILFSAGINRFLWIRCLLCCCDLAWCQQHDASQSSCQHLMSALISIFNTSPLLSLLGNNGYLSLSFTTLALRDQHLSSSVNFQSYFLFNPRRERKSQHLLAGLRHLSLKWVLNWCPNNTLAGAIKAHFAIQEMPRMYQNSVL